MEHRIIVVAGPSRQKFESSQVRYKPLFFLKRSTVPEEMLSLCKDTGTDHLELCIGWQIIKITQDHIVLSVDQDPLKYNLFLEYNPDNEEAPGHIVATFAKPVPITS
jgi:hypothetical protein